MPRASAAGYFHFTTWLSPHNVLNYRKFVAGTLRVPSLSDQHDQSYGTRSVPFTMASVGKVYLVGAGPGDPGLLTLRGAECLRAADVVLYDYLASPELLHGTRSDAELVCLGRHGHGRLMAQTDINERMVRDARAGRTVVRLQGG